MRINLFKPQITANNYSCQKRQDKNFSHPTGCDTVSFGMLPKSKLFSFDLVSANKFKFPLEKFKVQDDFDNHARNSLKGLFKINFPGYNGTTIVHRNVILKEWQDCLTEKGSIYEKKPSLSLIIYSFAVSSLRLNNTHLPPVLSKEALLKTVKDIETSFDLNPKHRFNFDKIYTKNLNEHYLNTIKGDGWIKIPSYYNDKKNFDSNVNKLRILSHKGWCTTQERAIEYLNSGDLYIYFKDKKPRVGIRANADKIQEIGGEKNNRRLPLEYLDEVVDFAKKNNFNDEKMLLDKAQIAKNTAAEKKLLFKEDIKNKDYQKILEHFGIKTETLKDGTLKLSHFKEAGLHYTFGDIGIDEDDMFKHISIIDGNADFRNSEVTDIGSLHTISGTANLYLSKIRKYDNLTHVGKFVTRGD